MGLGERAIDEFDWATYEVCSKTGAELASVLRSFIASHNSDQARALWWGIENVAFAQNTIFGVAEPMVEVLVAALADDRPTDIRRWIIELLRFLLSGGSPTDPGLASRCRHRARLGIWLLAREAKIETGVSRE